VGAGAEETQPLSNPRGRLAESIFRTSPPFLLPVGVAFSRALLSAPAVAGIVEMTALRPDIAGLPDLLHSHSRAGPVRERRPVYVDLLPPCNAGCPAGENIQAWLAHMQADEPELAWRALVADNPFAAIHGRVCYHPCESVCNRANLDSAVSIHSVERYLGDLALERGWLFDPPPAPSGKRVLVIGAGPSGLSAAYHLAKRGHEVEIRDAGAEPGGMMRYGIPAYRMPREVLGGEVERIAALGVRMTNNHRVVDLDAERHEGGFDAVFVAVGAHLSKRVEIPAMDAGPIVDAVSFLRGVASGETPVIGRRVAIYGGGNTAMDAARTARRLGAEETLIVYRRTREQMPAHEEEAQDAEREGVRINWLRTIKAFERNELEVEVMELDDSGFPQPTGRFETVAADTVILALGQETDTAFLRTVPGVEFDSDGTVQVSGAMMTGSPGVFAGGDMVPSERTVTIGVGHGKRAAREIDTWLRGTGVEHPRKHPPATFEMLNLWYFGDAARREQPELHPSKRVAAFEEVVGGLSPQEATFESHRCLSCGNCCECDGCLGACPEDAVIKLGKGYRYEFDYDRCTGCGACYEQCPVHSIEMIPEGAPTPPEAFVAPPDAIEGLR
jgi:NADPH-dependent glutamate synthase beta subunit-like oxidoreductase